MAGVKKTSSKSRAGRKAESRKPAKSQARRANGAKATNLLAAADAPAVAGIEPLMLSDCLDADAAGQLKDALLQRRGQSIVVDAGQVRRLGAQSLQILLAAVRTWRTDGHTYQLMNPSADFLDTMALAGLSRGDLLLEGPQS